MRARTPGRHAVAFVAITVAIDTIGFGLIMPVMPTLLTELTGETVNRAAIYGAAFFAAAILAMGSFVIYWPVTRERATASAGAVVPG